MEPRSTKPSTYLFFCTQAPIQGRSNCPARNGTRSCRTMSRRTVKEKALPWVCSSNPTSSGVMKMPSMLDAEAEQREQREGAKQDRAVQAPMCQALDGGLRRQTGAVEEEQEGDGRIGDPVGDHR